MFFKNILPIFANMKTLIIGAQIGEHYFTPGMRVSFVVDGEVDCGGTIERITNSGHWEEHLKTDFIIQWDDCTSPTRTHQPMIEEFIKPETK